MKQLFIGLLIGGVVGGAVGYITAKKRYEKLVNEALKEYEAAIPEEKKPKNMGEVLATHADPPDIMKKPDVNKTDYTSYFKTESVENVDIPNCDSLVNTEKPDVRNLDEQLNDDYLRDEVPDGEQPLPPFQCELEQIEHSSWPVTNATYYEAEDMVYDVDGYVLDEDDIGYDIRDMFGYGNDRLGTIYIHNERQHVNYEIEFSEGTYRYH